MQIYQTDERGVWDGAIREARPDPMTPGAYLIPARCYPDAPPAMTDRQAAVRNGDTWAVVPDFRGHEYWTPKDGTM